MPSLRRFLFPSGDNLAFQSTVIEVQVIPDPSSFGDGELVIGTSVADSLEGTAASDLILGFDGDDQITGGEESDILFGGLGVNTFIWLSGDQGSVATPSVDIVKDFNDDKLDFSDMLQGEKSVVLDQYLSFSYNGVADETTISVSPLGDGDVTQNVILEGVDLTDGGMASNSDIINDLLGDNQLIVDI